MDKVACCCVDFYQLPITQFLLGESFHPGGLKLSRQLAQNLLLGRESRVLDVASGKGTTSLWLAQHYGCEVVALDLAQQNLETGKKLAEHSQLGSQMEFVLASADKLPFADNSFDAIICECALCTFSNPGQALNEMLRVLKPGARLGISDIYLNRTLPQELDTLLSKVLCISGALSVEAYTALLKDSGLKKVKIQRVDWAITDMIEQIQSQVKILDSLPDNEAMTIPDWLGDSAPLLISIREFVESGGLGYALMVGKKGLK